MRSGGALTSSGKAPAPPERQGCAVNVRRFVVDCALPAAGGWSELAMAHTAGRLEVDPQRRPASARLPVAEHRSHGSPVSVVAVMVAGHLDPGEPGGFICPGQGAGGRVRTVVALIIRRSSVRAPPAPLILTWANTGARLVLGVMVWPGADQGTTGFPGLPGRGRVLWGPGAGRAGVWCAIAGPADVRL
jgi:hypothetical protein